MGNRAGGKVALISGGASGIGAATATCLIQEGASVIIGDTNEKAGRALADKLGSAASFARLDVVDEANWLYVIEEASRRLGRFDALVNSAAISGGDATVENIALESWNKTLAVNTTGPLLGCKYAIKAMKSFGNGGSIVNVSSALSIKVATSKVAYCASKAAVTHLTKIVALHCGKAGYEIRCNSVHPGSIDTPMQDESLPSFGNDRAAMLKEFGKYQALGRVGQPHEVAAAISFLISDDAQFITGSEMVVDGGFVLL
jgi:3(or 17)beta-hydroxysteroid dehydrogenase